MKHREYEYLGLDPFFGDESELSLHTKRIIKVRKEHPCYIGVLDRNEHVIQKGEHVVFEKALVDGDFFGRYYMCLKCLDKELDMYEEE